MSVSAPSSFVGGLSARLPLFAIYALALAAFAVGLLLRTPIIAIDNDLWYHLSHGRYVLSEGHVPTTSYFSFLQPQREWVDYYWFFQVLVFQIHRVAGYEGLIFLRVLVYGLFLFGVASCLRAAGRQARNDLWWALLFGLCAAHAFFKYQMVRPHTISYLLIPLFLMLLERGGRGLWLLPPLAVVWVNVHGIEYPVMLLILGAYFLEGLWNRWRGVSGGVGEGLDGTREATRRLACLGLSMAAVFATPHGGDLVRVPFVSTEQASFYIDELSKLPLGSYFSYAFSPSGFTTLTAANVLFLLALLAGLGQATRRRLRLGHLVLLVGAGVLLVKSVRFTYEASLLVLPLLAAHGPVWPSGQRRGAGSFRWSVAGSVLLGLLLLAPWLYLAHRMPDAEEQRPLSLRNLPHGIASFLTQVDTGGRVMNNPNVGGYLQWALPQGYRIFMDLEIPFLFQDEDIYEVSSAFFDATSLARFLERHDPTYIAATLAAPGFPGLIAAHSEYVLVFFDDTARLYVDTAQQPAVAARYGLGTLDPDTLARQRFSALDGARRQQLRADLEAILAIDGEVALVHQALAILANLEGDPARGLEHAKRVIAKDPGLPRGHAIAGDALVGLGEPEAAIRRYRRGWERAIDPGERAAIGRSLAAALAREERYERAYEVLAESLGTFDVEASPGDLYQLGSLAAASGHLVMARQLLGYAALKARPEDVELARRIEEARAGLLAGE